MAEGGSTFFAADAYRSPLGLIFCACSGSLWPERAGGKILKEEGAL
jgi:hypothetical protein